MRRHRYTDSVACQSFLVFFATFISSILNYVFHLVMSRLLSPSDYGVLSALLSIFMIVFLPLGAVQTVVAKYISSYTAQSSTSDMKEFILFSAKFMFRLGVLLLILGFVFIPQLASFLNIVSGMPLLALLATAFVYMFVPIVRGILQGQQKFIQFGVNLVAEAMFRLISGVLLIIVGLGVVGAVSSVVFAGGIAILLVLYPIIRICKASAGPKVILPLDEIAGFAFPTMMALLCFAIFTNIDVILVKHFFSPAEAGYYAVTAIVGRAFIFFPMSVALVIFPKASRIYAEGGDAYQLIKKGLIISGGILLLGITACNIFPRALVLNLFGEKYMEMVPALIRVIGLAISPLAILNLLINYNLALHRMRFIPAVFLMLIVYISLIFFFHGSLFTILTVLGVCGMLTVFVVLALCPLQ